MSEPIHDLLAAWSSEHLALLDKVCQPDGIFCVPHQLHGAEALKKHIQHDREAFPDLHLAIVDTVREGEKIACRLMVSGTHRGQLKNIPVTGRPFQVEAMLIGQVRDEKIARLWMVFDTLLMLQQLGVLPAPG